MHNEWWLDCGNIAALYRNLVDRDELDPSDVSEVAYFISKPWKWTTEWNDMQPKEQAHV